MKLRESEIVIGLILLVLLLGSIIIIFFVNKSFCGDGICSKNEENICIADCNWCGDGYCQENEMNICSYDCDWCGDGFCQEDESCSLCSEDCGDCKSDSYCGDGVCNEEECENGCTKDCRLIECQDGICEKGKGENCVDTPGDCKCNDNEKCNPTTKKCEVITCGNNICDSSETEKTCPNDCKEEYKETFSDKNTNLPVILVHGHSSDETESYGPMYFEEFQDKLVQEGYVDMGIILPSDYSSKLTKGIWSNKKVSVTTTYYANKYDKIGDIVGTDDNQHILTYAQRLRDVVEVVKHNTCKNKVIIIAHSMGGLVSRAYIKYYGGVDSVDKLIMIGTPNHGTYGVVSLGCGTFLVGRNPTPECNDMKNGSAFLMDLNSEDETPGDIKYLTIIGRNEKYNSCPSQGYWDNVICSDSTYLEGAENYYYENFLDSYSITNSLHVAMVYPSKAPEVYNKVVSFIKE